MFKKKPHKLTTDLWKESLLKDFLSDLSLEDKKELAVPRLFLRAATYYSSHTALMEKRNNRYQRMPYRELAKQAERFAAGLIQSGFRPGDRVAIMLNNSTAWAIADLGTMMAAGSTVPVYMSLSASAAGFILHNAEVSVAVVEDRTAYEKIRESRSGLPHLKSVIVRNAGGIAADEDIRDFEAMLIRGDDLFRSDPGVVARTMAQIKRDDLASIVYTSGTTGNPKGVMLTHGNFISNVLGVASVTDLNSLDVFLSVLPLSHTFERTVGYYAPLFFGATIAYAEGYESISKNLQEVRPTICCAVPRMFESIYSRMMRTIKESGPVERMVLSAAMSVGGRAWKSYERWRQRHFSEIFSRHLYDERTQEQDHVIQNVFLRAASRVADRLVYAQVRQKMGGRLRYFVSGGAPLSSGLIHFFRNLGITIYEGYGLTETSPVISFNYRDTFKVGTVGKLLPNVRVELSKEGEILVRGPSVMRGYFKNPEATAEVLDEEGWFHTGDVGVFDNNNFLSITDRIKELIVMSNGKKVAPLPIENQFTQFAWISQTVLLGNNQKYIAALFFPNEKELTAFTESGGNGAASLGKLCAQPRTAELFSDAVRCVNRNLSPYEHIKKFKIVPASLSIEDGDLTPTLKVKRRVIEQKYRDAIQDLFD